MKLKKSSKEQVSVNYSSWALSLLMIPLIILAMVCGLISLANKEEVLDKVGLTSNRNNENSSNRVVEPMKFTQISPQKKPSLILTVEIAHTEEQRRTGLMNRKSLGSNEGMLFVFEKSNYQSFWMKNTYIPLDIAFIDDEKTVINISKNVTPLNETLTYRSSKPALYVIETNANWFEKNDIKAGDKLEFHVEGKTE